MNPPLGGRTRQGRAAKVAFETIGRSRIVEVQERGKDLIAPARAEVQQVAAVVHRYGMVAMLADEAGAIVQVAGDARTLSPRLRLAARQGVDLSERAAGTNAVGTALIDQSLLSIVAHEHYFESDAGLTCVAAPVRTDRAATPDYRIRADERDAPPCSCCSINDIVCGPNCSGIPGLNGNLSRDLAAGDLKRR